MSRHKFGMNKSAEEKGKLSKESDVSGADVSADEIVEISPEAVADEESDAAESAVPEVGEAVESELDRFLRLAAEFDNYKKRTAREFGEIVKTANGRLLKSLVEILDSFERALQDAAGQGSVDAYRQGVELIHSQLLELLSKERVTPIKTVGEPFDPAYHEAMMKQNSDEYAEGLVSMELQKGYMVDGRVLRHARVAVSSGPQKTENENKK